jgi:2-polyprenyl-3-methyl-5-hydroxy-6-metoxy-1,4-benzoquinol methylase
VRALPRWHEISQDPNSPEVIARREQDVRAARARPVAERTAYLSDLVRGKRLLDLGVVDHFAGSGQHLHRQLAGAAVESLGIDVVPDGIEALRREGFNVRTCDITRDAIDGAFDVIVAGELIEHLGRPEALFQIARRNLAPGGRLVLTTPNPYYLGRIRDSLLGRSRENADHVSLWSPSGIAEMAEREGLRLDRYRGVSISKTRTVMGKLLLRLGPLLDRLSKGSDALCSTFIFECVKP